MMKLCRSLTLALGLALSASPLALDAAFAKDLLVVDLVNEPSSLDPHKQWNPDSYYVYRNIFDNLVTRDDDGTIVPQIATEWRAVSDTEIVFTIRDDVTFHDGEKLTAEDVAFSAASPCASTATTTIGATRAPSRRPSSAPCRMPRPASPICRPARPTSR